MTPSFQELKTKIVDLEAQLQELISAVYVIRQHDDEYEFVTYYDKQSHKMGFAMLISGIEVKLFDSIPEDIILAYADFIRLVRKYESGEIDFPFVLQEQEQEPEYTLSELKVNE